MKIFEAQSTAILDDRAFSSSTSMSVIIHTMGHFESRVMASLILNIASNKRAQFYKRNRIPRETENVGATSDLDFSLNRHRETDWALLAFLNSLRKASLQSLFRFRSEINVIGLSDIDLLQLSQVITRQQRRM